MLKAQMNRRGFLKFLGLAPVAAPLAAKEIASSGPACGTTVKLGGWKHIRTEYWRDVGEFRKIDTIQASAGLPKIPSEAVTQHVTTLKMSPEYLEHLRLSREKLDDVARAVKRHGAPDWLKQRVAQVSLGEPSNAAADDSGVEFVNGYPNATDSDSTSEPSERENPVPSKRNEIDLLIDGVEAISG